MKKVLIISPFFPPSNAADMQRVRMSLPYFSDAGWIAEVVCVSQKHSEMLKDDLLLLSLPPGQIIHEVNAFALKWTSKIGLGSLALRSLWYYFKKVNRLLSENHYDLVYFSTTQFLVTVLGRYWKNRFHIPYVIDMQDPWHSEYYRDKPKEVRPPKYWFSYRLHKWLEPVAIKKVDGIISVSKAYIDELKARYPVIAGVPAETITFGFSEIDNNIALQNINNFNPLLDQSCFNIVYVGRGGMDMHQAIAPVFMALEKGIAESPGLFKNLKFYFIGTSYATDDRSRLSIFPLAKKYGIEHNVVEITQRVSYYHTLSLLQQADALFVPGSDDPQYTASKFYPYLTAGKPLLSVLHRKSPAIAMLKESTENVIVHTFPGQTDLTASYILDTLTEWMRGVLFPVVTLENFNRYHAAFLTREQTKLFDLAAIHLRNASDL